MEMRKRAKSEGCSKYNNIKLSVEVPVDDTGLSFPQSSSKLRASNESMEVGSKSGETKPESKVVLRKKRKRKSKNVHLKAVTKKACIDRNAPGGSPSPQINDAPGSSPYPNTQTDKPPLSSPNTQTNCKNKKQQTCYEHTRENYTAGEAVISGQNCNSMADKAPLQPKVLLKAWPCRSSEPKKDCSKVTVKKTNLDDCRLCSKSFSSHRCFDFASGSTVRSCCLSSELGFWVSADPHAQSLAKHKPVNPRVVAQEENQKASPKTRSSPSRSKDTSGHSELPGFYYDPEIKRYFKIVSSSYNRMSNVVTRERIRFDKAEKLRQEELKSLASTGQLKDPKHQTTVRNTTNILTLIDRAKQGIVRQETSAYQLRRLRVAKLRPQTGKGNKCLESTGTIIQRMRINARENLLVICHSNDVKTAISLMKINGFKSVPNGSGNEDDTSFAVDLREKCSNICDSRLLRVSDFCFATPDSASAVLYCANDHLLGISNILIFRRIVKSPAFASLCKPLIWKKTRSYLMCCALTSDSFAVGTECNVFLCNYTKSSLITQLDTSNTSIHALTFANTSSKVLFCAARNGRILMYDELSSRRRPAAYLAQTEGFSSDLFMTKDDRYLLSAKYNGQNIEKWDIRQGRVVLEYPGHVSECARTPLVVDQREEFLSAVGSDSYTRIWDVKTGELMKVLPPPLPATKENIPSVCFIDLYGESRNNYPGLLLGMSDELHFYSL